MLSMFPFAEAQEIVSPFSKTDKRINSLVDLIESKKINSGLIEVYCIGGYVFVTMVPRDVGLTQLMKQSPETSAKSHPTPMTCSEYLKKMES